MEGRGDVLTPWARRLVGILWILSVAAVQSCPDQNNASMNCSIIPVEGLSCSYVKGPPTDQPIDNYQVPAAISLLEVGSGYTTRNGKCETRLNVTWKVESDASLDRLRGFYMNMSFVYNGNLTLIHRTFNVSATDWNKASKTLFIHDCVIPARGTEYRIELYSLPMNYMKHHKSTTYHTTRNMTSDTLCNRTGDPDNTSTWIANMWTVENSLLGSIEVCFFTAPPSYNFTKYAVSLLPNAYDPLNKYVEQKIVFVDVFKDLKICQKFMNVCSGVYKIWVMPVNEPTCTCRYKGICFGSCTATVVDNIDMTMTFHRPKQRCGGSHKKWRTRGCKPYTN